MAFIDNLVLVTDSVRSSFDRRWYYGFGAYANGSVYVCHVTKTPYGAGAGGDDPNPTCGEGRTPTEKELAMLRQELIDGDSRKDRNGDLAWRHWMSHIQWAHRRLANAMGMTHLYADAA